MIHEGAVRLDIAAHKTVSKDMEVFYNPVMKLNRDVSIAILDAIDEEGLQIALPLAGSGIRGLRMIAELPAGKIKRLVMNDHESSAQIKEQLAFNRMNDTRVSVEQKDATLFLLQSKGFDYIDIDPFGTPNPFLDAAIKRLSRRGILAVTATDTAAATGSSRNAGIRKYWAQPLKNYMMHETAIRILIRKIQLIGAQYDKALTPIFSYAKDHYYRLFLRCVKGKKKVDSLLKNHQYLLYNRKTMEIQTSQYNRKEGFIHAGPLWTGQLWDAELTKHMLQNADSTNDDLYKLLTLAAEESRIDAVGFYDLHELAACYGKDIPKTESVLDQQTSRTHFTGWGVRSSKAAKELADSF